MSSGAVDAATRTFNYTPSELPVLTLIGDLIVFGTDPRAGAAAMTKSILIDCAACQEEAEQDNIEILFAVSTAPYNLMCKGN
ncbi:hypothetical protein SAMN04488094_103318 [Tropicimonas isoalkanivorans]|uniref:Uncharacterized protein n=1 Tax=Tropicimonas isoalkanivorans TaxID=441112 RepID=A0A1I1HWL1_9RHOB|nr:hypothetical protein SAMN04488094_103318 [Tropicimonas isoalkanivorans]